MTIIRGKLSGTLLRAKIFLPLEMTSASDKISLISTSRISSISGYTKKCWPLYLWHNIRMRVRNMFQTLKFDYNNFRGKSSGTLLRAKIFLPLEMTSTSDKISLILTSRISSISGYTKNFDPCTCDGGTSFLLLYPWFSLLY